MDDDPIWYGDNEAGENRPASQGGYAQGRGQQREDPRSHGTNARGGARDRRAPRAPRTPSTGRDAPRSGTVAGWGDPEPHGEWDDGPRNWNDKRWWLEEAEEARDDRDNRVNGRPPRRAPNRYHQRGPADYEVGDGWSDANQVDRQRPRHDVPGRPQGPADWWESSRQWATAQGQRWLGTGSPTKSKPGALNNRRRTISVIVLVSIIVCAVGSGLTTFVLYQQVNAMAHSGLQHIKNAEADLKKVQSNPFDAASIQAAHAEFGAANSDFGAVNARLNLVGIASAAPVVGSKVSGAQKLIPIAVEATQAGMLACDALSILATALKSPFGTTGGGFTTDQYANLASKWSQLHMLAITIIEQLGQLTPSDLTLDPRLGPIFGQFRAQLPKITQLVDDFDGVVAALPQLFGVTKPSTYLMLILDSSELRPTGGFIGNFGALAVNKGQMDPGFHISDITLIDSSVKFGTVNYANFQSHFIPIPNKYSWLKTIFTTENPSWSLRDSNLDPDYPTTAKYAMSLYSELLPYAQANLQAQGSTFKLYDPKVSGQFAGVVTLSLGFFVQALKITGAIQVPQFHETITSDNFVSRIHYYALSGAAGTGPDNQACGTTSCSKVFTSAVVQAFMAKIKSNLPAYIGGLGKVFFDSLRTKDIEVFVNDPKSEQALIDLGIGATVQAPATGDSVFEVESNIGANKDNSFLKYQMADQITVDEAGAATHHLTWQYTWPNDPKTYAESFPAGSYNYHSYSRVFTPPGATLISRANLVGFSQIAASADTFNRKVFHGAAYAYFAKTTKYGVTWKTPGVVTHDSAGYHYQLLFQREAGIVWPLTITIALPACAKIIGTPQTSGLTPLNLVKVSGTTVTVTGPLTQDEQFQIDYTC